MSALVTAFIGLYIIGVGWNANGIALIKFLGSQKNFVTWFIAIIILYALTRVKKVKPFVIPFISLAVVAVILKQWNQIEDEIKNLSGGAK